jgi:predicted permease
LRFAIRLFRKDRAFALATILTVALCIGANAAIFTVVRSVLLRPLPYPSSDRLVILFDSFPGAGVERAGTSVPNYFDRLAFTDVLESQALYQFGGFRAGEGPAAEGVSALNVTPSFFRVLQTRAARGRLFSEEEGTPGRNRVAVLNHAFAARQPGGVDGVVGRELRLDDTRYTVVGVLPEDFTFLNPDVRVFVPLAFTAEQRADEERHSQNHEQIGRLAPGASIAQAQARIDALNATIVERAGVLKSTLINAKYHTRIVSLESDVVRSVRGALQMLWGGVACLLLIAAVNITNLSLARANSRVKELATRHALGAARRRVVRQLVTETTVLTLLGGAIGLALGFWSLGALNALGLADIPRAHEIRMDAIVVVFILALGLALGVSVGAVPAMHVAGVNLGAALREDGRTTTGGRRAQVVRGTLVVAQVALAFVLLIAAGLLLASFRHLLAVDPGFRSEHVLTGRVSLLPAAYPDNAALNTYAARALARLRALPGVEAAGGTSFLPFSWDNSSGDHSRRKGHDAGRIGRIAEPVARDARLSRGVARAAAARPLLR